MTDTSALPTLVSAAPRPIALSWRPLLLAAVIAAAAAGWLATTPDAMAQAGQDAELTMLLRFMATVKALMALAALAATFWRLGYPASAPLATAYAGSAVLMCAAPGLIWQLAHVAVGAALFHAGLLLLVVALFADRGQVSALTGATIGRLRRSETRL